MHSDENKEQLEREPVRLESSQPETGATTPDTLPKTDTLVVVSKVKALIREQSSLNTSEDCVAALTRKVVEECLKGIERAKAAGRKTVMGRDIL